MTAYASLGDVQMFTLNEPTPAQSARIPALLDQATARINAYIRRDLNKTQTTSILRSVGAVCTLPKTPVLSVDSVKLIDYLGRAWDVPVFGFDSIDRLDLSFYNAVVNLPAVMLDATWSGSVEVTYTHGYDQIPQEIVDLTAELVARVLNSPMQGVTGVRGQTVGPYSVQIDSSGAGGGLISLTPDDKQLLAKYRRKPQAVELR